MEALLTYTIQINLLLGLLFLGYQLLLKNLTFYKLNRVYFLVGTLYAFIYPFLDINSWFAKKIEFPQGIIMEYIPFVLDDTEETFSLSDLLVYVIGVGAIILLIKLLIQLSSLLKIHWYSKPSQWRQYLFRNVVFPITPFSFLNKIYLHKEQHQDLELNDIFKHEYVHVKGHHSIDVLLFEIVLLCCWFNPFVWYMRKAVRQNLEFLTDQQVLDKGVDRQTYQYSLLNVTKQGASVGISNQFNFKTLKKRIMMMNKKRSSRLELGKYVFLLPILIMAGITFTVNQAEAKIESVVFKMKETDLNQQIKQIIIQTPKKDTIKNDTSNIESVRIINTREYADYVQPGVASGSGESRINPVGVVRMLNNEQGKNPLVILDGERMPKNFNMGIINTNSIESLTILKDTAVETYGEDAKDGVFIITTKKEVAVKGYPSNRKLNGVIKGLSVKKNNSSDSVSTNQLSKISINTLPPGTKIIFDGKEANQEDLEKINPNDLESVEVLKDGEGVGKPTIIFTSTQYVKENNLESVTVVGKPRSGAARMTVRGEAATEPTRIQLRGVPANSSSSETQSIEGKGNQTQQVPTVNAGRSLYKTYSIRDSAKNLLNRKDLKNAYFLVNGKPTSYKNINKLDFKSINWLEHLPPSDSLKEKFGKKAAKNGVIIIKTN